MTLSVVLAGGGTTGHVAPLLALAGELRRTEPGTVITVLGTAEGLEARLVPEAGYPLETIPRVPFPRRPSAELLQFSGRLRTAIKAAEDAITGSKADVVVGFGGYVSTPAYLAARRLRVPIVVHEANARPGLANRLGARFARFVAVTFPNTPLPRAEVTGMPLRRGVVDADLAALRPEALAQFGFQADQPTLLVTGGSLGAQRLNTAFGEAGADLVAAGVQVLHLCGRDKQVPLSAELVGSNSSGGPRYVVLEYLDRMELAFAAADLVVCRAGAGTVAEVTALGLPAVFVPLPIGNGEQRLNAAPVVADGGGLLVADADVNPEWVRREVVTLLTDTPRLTRMATAATAFGIRDGAERLAALVRKAAGEGR